MTRPDRDLALAAFRLIAVQGASRTEQADDIWRAVMASELTPVLPTAVDWLRDGQQYRAHDPALLAGLAS